jgi:predicted PurR-regulated permease PerM
MTINNAAIINKIGVIILVVLVGYLAKVLLMPLCIAGILATSFLPLCNWLEKHKTPRWLAALLCLLVLVFIIFGFVAILGLKLADLLNDVTLMKQKIIDVVVKTQNYLFKHLGISVAKQTEIFTNEQPSYTGIMQLIANSLFYIFSNLVLIFIYVSFLLFYRSHIKKFMLQLASSNQRADVEKIINTAANVSHQYLIGMAKMIVSLWVMYGIGFSIIGVDNAIFFAILCGLLEIVPYVGNITGTLLTVFVAALHGASPSLIGGILIIYASVQLIQGWLLEPLILGPQVKINPLFTIIALLAGELIWGIPGIILAIPLTAIFKIICDHVEPLKPYGFLIGEIATKKVVK